MTNKPFMGQYWRCENQEQFDNAKKDLERQWKNNRWIEIKCRTPKNRSLKQNNSMYKFFKDVADTLNDHGLYMQVILKPGFNIPWTQHSVKDLLWKTIQKKQTGKESTAELESHELDLIYDALNAHFVEWGIHVEFPSMNNEQKH
jgi:hypothetical protein